MRGWLLAVALGVAGTASARTFFPRTVKCPVGGKPFEYMAYGSYSRWGVLPDGQPVGSAEYPLEMPQCPDNGLVLFDEFDTPTIARLTPLVRSPEYQALRRTETRYYLAHWLQVKLGAAEADRLWMLLTAGWEAKSRGTPEQAVRYQAEFVRGALALPDDPALLTPLALKARAVNALRELGRFEEAERLRASLSVLPTMDAGEEGSAKNREGWTRYLASLQPVIARRDASRAPIDLISDREARFRCLEPERPTNPGPPLTAFERDYCARPAVQDGLKSLREAWGIKPVNS
jgi:hypothetical protein